MTTRGKKGRAALEGLCFLQNAALLYCRYAVLNKTQPFFLVGLSCPLQKGLRLTKKRSPSYS